MEWLPLLVRDLAGPLTLSLAVRECIEYTSELLRRVHSHQFNTSTAADLDSFITNRLQAYASAFGDGIIFDCFFLVIL